jgi:hypothetical protein
MRSYNNTIFGDGPNGKWNIPELAYVWDHSIVIGFNGEI